jgi:hypothetical protein
MRKGIPCSESYWLRQALLGYLSGKMKRVSRDELYNAFSASDEMVINELKCLMKGGYIRALYVDMKCFFEIVQE